MPPFSPLTITSPQMHPIRTPRSRRQSSPRPISFFTFKWKHASKEVYVTGTFDNWSCSIPMKRTTIDGEEFEATIALDRTQDIEFKFVADGVWRCGFYPTKTDHSGHVNNVLEAIPFFKDIEYLPTPQRSPDSMSPTSDQPWKLE